MFWRSGVDELEWAIVELPASVPLWRRRLALWLLDRIDALISSRVR